MTPSHAIELSRSSTWRNLAAAALAASLALVASPVGMTQASSELVDVIVRGVASSADAAAAVLQFGGTVERELDIIGSVSAQVPADRIGQLRADPRTIAVAPDTSVTLNQTFTLEPVTDEPVLSDTTLSGVKLAPAVLDIVQPGSPEKVNAIIGADTLHARGITGRGVDVAVIDSGVLPVGQLAEAGRVITGPDISFEGFDPAVATLDTYGHGTHMSGIISSVAPGARIVSVKVATATGATDVSQVIAAIQWVVENRDANGMNIRVLNLSFGTDGRQSPSIDPLSYAVEAAWAHGITVVVSAGNGGSDLGRLNNPATNATVIAVGAVDTKGTTTTSDDSVPAWSSQDRNRNPDVGAPGRSIVSLRAPGSWIDLNHPGGLVSTTTFKGSGTSQAAAVVSGAAALLISERPDLTPDQVKGMLKSTAIGYDKATRATVGRGLIDVASASGYRAYNRIKAQPTDATGTGTLDGARGSNIVTFADGSQLTGDQMWNGSTWTGSTWTGSTWTGSTWTGSTWTGGAWNGSTWTGSTWTGSTWTGSTWTGSTWTGSTWTGSTWTGSTWTGSTWTGSTWTATASWDGVTWD